MGYDVIIFDQLKEPAAGGFLFAETSAEISPD